jgi:hypothetical protein
MPLRFPFACTCAYACLRVLSFSCFAGTQAPFYRLLVPQPVKICPGLFFFYQQKAIDPAEGLESSGETGKRLHKTTSL